MRFHSPSLTMLVMMCFTSNFRLAIPAVSKLWESDREDCLVLYPKFRNLKIRKYILSCDVESVRTRAWLCVPNALLATEAFISPGGDGDGKITIYDA